MLVSFGFWCWSRWEESVLFRWLSIRWAVWYAVLLSINRKASGSKTEAENHRTTKRREGEKTKPGKYWVECATLKHTHFRALQSATILADTENYLWRNSVLNLLSRELKKKRIKNNTTQWSFWFKGLQWPTKTKPSCAAKDKWTKSSLAKCLLSYLLQRLNANKWLELK